MKIVVTGAGGFLGGHIAAEIAKYHEVTGAFHSSRPSGEIKGVKFTGLEVADVESVESFFESERPDAVVHAAAMPRIAACESDPETARAVNTIAASNISKLSKKYGAYPVFLSTDMVFDGESAPYGETDDPGPLSVYGRSKLEAEKYFTANGVVLRLALCYGLSLFKGKETFFEKAVDAMANGEQAVFFNDEWRTPLWSDDLARLMVAIIKTRPAGLIHVGGPERLSRLEMGLRACEILGFDPSVVKSVSRKDIPGPPRPKDLSFDISKLGSIATGFEFTPFDESVALCFKSL